ncbi:MAG: response regulator [Ignavibacteriales bacterium]|nr:MAG: response regulator [Ignavibacteriales bacterium]
MFEEFSLKKILIVDDSDILRKRLIEAILSENIQLEIYEADSPSTGLNSFFKHHQEIVILDNAFPVGTGLDIISNIKAEHPQTVLIMLTNYPHEKVKLRAIQLGVDYFLDKSNEFETAVKIIAEWSEKDLSFNRL